MIDNLVRDSEKNLVLIIDDDEDSGKVLEEALSMMEFRTCRAADGKSGVEMAWEKKPDAVIMDICMPGLDGWETASLIRQSPGLRSVPVIFMSGDMSARVRYFNNTPFNSSFVPKPYHLRLLETLLRAFIRLRTGAGGDGMDLPKAWEGKSGPVREVAFGRMN